MNEIWKPVPGYEGLYEVSDHGNVMSLNYRGSGMTHTLSQAKNKKGYNHVVLSNGKTHKTFQVHRLVASAFVPNPDNLPQVNHKDKNPGNNCADNLEWCTEKYNIDHAQGRLGVFESYIKENKIKEKIYNQDWYAKKKSLSATIKT